MVKWIAGLVARGVMWVLAAKMGYDVSQTEQVTVVTALEGLGALVLVVVSAYSSLKGRQILLTTEPPKGV
jgi:hypothetical protein